MPAKFAGITLCATTRRAWIATGVPAASRNPAPYPLMTLAGIAPVIAMTCLTV